MKITKLGHCCLLIEIQGKRLLTDPGSYTVEEHSKLREIDFVLFTHEHGDHYHLESLKVILDNNPQAQIYANTSVGELLNKENIEHVVVHDGEEMTLDGIALHGVGNKHALFHSSLPLAANTGFFIDNRLFYPGDAFTNPNREVEILALPVAGPWMKISEAIDYALLVKPKVAFPVHDGLRYGATHHLPSEVLPKSGIKFVPMVEGDTREF